MNIDLSESNELKLQILNDIWEVSTSASVKTYIWAGLVRDITNGHFESEHGDIDGFTEDLWSKKDLLKSLYEKRGYKVQLLKEWHILRIDKKSEHAGFNPLILEKTMAHWHHIGKRGTFTFPSNWLDSVPNQFYNTKVFTSGLEFEYAFRTLAPKLNPDWKKRRPKDIIAIKYYKKKLLEQGKDTEKIVNSVSSYNPFWLQYGYKEGKPPVTI